MNAFYEINLLKPFSIGANDPTESPCIGSLVISTYLMKSIIVYQTTFIHIH